MIFINPKIDWAFKKIFGSSESKDILISFLNALVYDGIPTIKDLEIINPNLPPALQGLKDTYLDVKAKLLDGTIVIIEMQVLNVESFGKRVLYNAAKTYAFQLESGEGYRMLKPVIALTITDFKLFAKSDSLVSRFIYKEKTTNFEYTDNNIELVFVELPKFTKELAQLETIADKWIYFMKYARSLTEVPETMDSIPAIHKAFEIANQANLSREEREEIEKREMFVYDQQGAISLGKAEGKQEEKLEIARKLLALLDNETISQTTGISVDEVQNLRETND
ncbi:Rpn family recombination-promoting nuclease/putative transposase [Limnofasciculus baicalensis]|uniref:Rpn family recombination-promoting nuclease/putative transposase n=1 Tax=Limnofasciculus baicalensis BBK-W-15 TaxID=2699891 RepID=A0AAE3GM05_9CYAN|nr:Rpn family recombination-promoting nuclease/putative transposase [Limnofasciculus baicalensis]MCP2727040.1 Rpn family recombination-promoting nuclease/putative transposase [Limnofasciculus baicalensis BBK-W-15]